MQPFFNPTRQPKYLTKTHIAHRIGTFPIMHLPTYSVIEGEPT